jgi:hypothetical protein
MTNVTTSDSNTTAATEEEVVEEAVGGAQVAESSSSMIQPALSREHQMFEFPTNGTKFPLPALFSFALVLVWVFRFRFSPLRIRFLFCLRVSRSYVNPSIARLITPAKSGVSLEPGLSGSSSKSGC